MSGKIRVIHVGCGGICGAWLKHPCIKDDVEIVALVDLNPEHAKKRAAEFGLENAEISADLEAMLKKHRPDAVFDLTIPAAHKSVTVTALKHGCHVLGEKPMADSMDAARAMVAAAQQAGKTYAVTQTRRWNKQLRRFVEFLRSGAIGEVETVQSDFFIGAHFGGFRAAMQHVLVLDMAIHTFDAARLIADSDPQSVICEDWNPDSSWYAHGASAMAFFRMDKNIRYLYHGSWCPEGLNTSWECNWRVIGSRGSASWDGRDTISAEQIDTAAAKGFSSRLIPAVVPDCRADMKDGGHEGVIREFIDCLQRGTEPETICTDNIRSLAMVMAAIESAEKDGARVAIKL